jgi:hypothetical protein
VFLDNVPIDHGPTAPEEGAAVREAPEAAARGQTIWLDMLLAEPR